LLRKYISPILFHLILLCCLSQAWAGENEDFRFAEKLRRDKMFVAAAEEYIRFCDRYPESNLCPRALFLAGESWMQAGRAGNALESFQDYLNRYPGAEEVCKARFYRGRIMKKLEMYREAASEFLMVNDEYPGCALAGRSLLEAGESLLKAGNPEEASLVLRKLIKVTENDELIPIARYSLALALINMDRELEAYRELETLAEKYTDSPLAGMALLKLGKDAASSGRTDRAEEYFNRLLETRQEQNLREKGIFNLILLYSETGNREQLLEKARRYLSIFDQGERRVDVYHFAIKASDLLEDGEKTLGLIERYRAEYPEADSTGWTYGMKARIMGNRGETDRALEELNRMAERYPGSVYAPEILILKAELNSRKGRYSESARFYRMALSEGLDPELEDRALTQLARLYLSELNDTMAAAGLWEEAALSAPPELREKALFNAAGARESAGDLDGSAALYRKIIEEFPGGEREAEARRKLELISLLPEADQAFAGSVQRLLAGGEVPGSVLIDAAGTYLDYSLVEQALIMLEEAAARQLDGDDPARLEFYMGQAHSDRYRRNLLRGEENESDLEKALLHWRTAANRYSGTSWGEKSYRSYLELKFEDWNLSRRLSGLDKFMEYYGSRESRIWALGKKAEYLFAEAGGAAWAADSALTVCRRWESLSPPECDIAEITRMKAYIYEQKGDFARAAEFLSRYTGEYSSCGCDPEAGYDLGELRIRLKQYSRAMEAYQYCLDCGTGAMRMNCRLRKGDCYFYLKDYARAEQEYRSVSKRSPGSKAAAVADFRRALALEEMGEDEKADSIYTALLEKDNAGGSIRVRAMEKLGRKNLQTGNYNRAAEYYSELVRITGSPDNRMVYAEILLKQGDYEQAEKLFSGALRYEEADSLRILAGRAKAGYRAGRVERADADLALLREKKPSDRRIPEVILEKGRVLIENEQYGAARDLFDSLADRYDDYLDESLYYLALCDIQGGGYREAEEKLVRHLREAPHSSLSCAAAMKLAFVQAQMEKFNLAARNYSLAAESCTDRELRFRALRNLADIYQKMEKWEQASSVWFSLVEDYPARDDIVDILFNLGFAYGQSGQYRLARDVYTRITSITAEEAELGRAYYWIGINLKNLGEYEEAVRQFLRVPYLRTGGMWGVTSRLEAAGCYRKLGRYDEAAGIYRSVLQKYGEESDWGRIAAGYLEQINDRQKQTDGQQ